MWIRVIYKRCTAQTLQNLAPPVAHSFHHLKIHDPYQPPHHHTTPPHGSSTTTSHRAENQSVSKKISLRVSGRRAGSMAAEWAAGGDFSGSSNSYVNGQEAYEFVSYTLSFQRRSDVSKSTGLGRAPVLQMRP